MATSLKIFLVDIFTFRPSFDWKQSLAFNRRICFSFDTNDWFSIELDDDDDDDNDDDDDDDNDDNAMTTTMRLINRSRTVLEKVDEFFAEQKNPSFG